MSEANLRNELARDTMATARPVIVSRAGAIAVLLSLFAAIVCSFAMLQFDPAIAKRVESLNSYGAVRSSERLPHGERTPASMEIAAMA